jgi:hypothetical protein
MKLIKAMSCDEIYDYESFEEKINYYKKKVGIIGIKDKKFRYYIKYWTKNRNVTDNTKCENFFIDVFEEKMDKNEISRDFMVLMFFVQYMIKSNKKEEKEEETSF